MIMQNHKVKVFRRKHLVYVSCLVSMSSGSTIDYARESSYPTPYSNSVFLPLLLLSLARQKNSPDISASFKDAYDYIVIGAGSAGATVAARLSEVPCVSVLLLEAGSTPPKLTDLVSIVTSFWSSSIDWTYQTAPQKYTGNGLKNRQINWPSGKVLGGSSVINGGLYTRGNRKDYDDWAAMGAEGWSYDEVLPYFKKMEDNKNIVDFYHGVGGPVTIMRPPYEPEIKGPIVLTATAMGYKFVDPNGQNQTGFYDLQDNMRDGQRCSTAKAYLVPAENRPNLDILADAMVEKIIIKNERATGVLFSNRNQTYLVKAKREVILSAGTVNSAQLLMLSGIGPKEELRKFNIPVYADLPVGKNLQDHCGTFLNFVLRPEIQPVLKKLVDPANIQRYISNRTGPLASAAGMVTVAFLYKDEIRPVLDFPNYQLDFFEAAVEGHKEIYNLKDEVYQQVYAPYENQPIMTCELNNLRPWSRGTVTLKSANPYDYPIIDPNYLEDPRDLEDIVQGLKTCRRIGNSDYMKSVVKSEFQTLYPGCEKFARNEDLYFECLARTELFTTNHQSSTAKMGHPCDPTTVVDPQLRVKNIAGLRVVDNSVMPKIVSGNTNVPAIMIGEKAADMIKNTIRCMPYPCALPQNGGNQQDILILQSPLGTIHADESSVEFPASIGDSQQGKLLPL